MEMSRHPFVRNAWYAAGWIEELTEKPRAIRMLDRPLVLFRAGDGTPVAMDDRCPHRFAPLSLGEIRDGALMCRYHGLRFDQRGNCIHNPFGKDNKAPAAVRVRTYPVAIRYGMIWVWMGEEERADEKLLPVVPFLDDGDFAVARGYLNVAAHYELVTDNLLDLTHAQFLHPFLASEDGANRTKIRFEHEDRRVSSFYDIRDEPVTGLFQLFYRGRAEQVDMYSYIHWTPPSNLWLDVGIRPDDLPPAEWPKVPSAHFLTPETEDSTHYFWASGRNCQTDDPEIGMMLKAGIAKAFENEDEPMIQAVRSRMSSNDLFAEKPLLLPTDEAGVRARRMVRKMIEGEQPA